MTLSNSKKMTCEYHMAVSNCKMMTRGYHMAVSNSKKMTYGYHMAISNSKNMSSGCYRDIQNRTKVLASWTAHVLLELHEGVELLINKSLLVDSLSEITATSTTCCCTC